MKNIKYLVMLAVMAVMASFTSCMDDNNDWGVDPSANGNRTWAPLELKVEKGDTFLKIFGFKATNATSYVAQVSQVNFEGASEEDIISYEFTRNDMTPETTRDTMTLGNLEPKTSYYLRVKARATGKEDSQWVEYSKDGNKTVKTEAPAIAASKIEFTENYAAGTVPAYFHDKAMTLYLTDANGKMAIDGSTKKFSDEREFTKRLKSGGKSSEGTNSMVMSVSVNGTLTIYPYAGSSDPAKVSNLIVTQNGKELLNVAQVTGSGEGEAYVITGVKAGKVEITYPTNSVNFYGFTYEMDEDETYVEDEVKEPEPEPEPEPQPGDGFEGTFALGSMSSAAATANATWGTVAFDGSDIPSLSATGGTELTLTPTAAPDITICYTNSGDKSNVFKCAANFLVVDSKNGIIKINNLAVGQTIKVTFTAKGSTAAVLTASKGATGESVTSETTSDSKTAVFTSTAASVQLKETSGGMRIYSIEVIK